MTPADAGTTGGVGVTYIEEEFAGNPAITTLGTISPLPTLPGPPYFRLWAMEIVAGMWSGSIELQPGNPDVPAGTIIEIGGERFDVDSNGSFQGDFSLAIGVPVSIKYWYPSN